MQVLGCRDLSKCFGRNPALHATSLSLGEGEHLAITGPSGSGKTTLLRLLAGLLDPTTGVVVEGGKTVSRPGWRMPPFRRGIGMLFQGLALWPHLSARENISFALSSRRGVTGGVVGRREARLRTEQTLFDLGLAGLSTRYPSELSGGERQRVAWARAVAGGPRLLLLDEPLTSLDPALRGELIERVAAYCATPGKTVVLVTHEVDLARRLGIGVLRLGGPQ